MSRTRLLRRLAVIFAVICILLVGWYSFSVPKTLTIAVGPSDSTQYQFVHASARALKDTQQSFRLKIVPEKDSTSASKALDNHKVDLAVLRSDDNTSSEARSLAIIHKRAVLLVTHRGNGIGSVSDLKGRSTAIVSHPGESNRALIDRMFQHFGSSPEELNMQEISTRELAQSPTRYDAYLVITEASQGGPKAVFEAIAGPEKRELQFIGMPAPEGLVLRFRELQKSTIPVGAFGGTPPSPAVPVDTVAITYELAATDDLSQTEATNLLEALVELRTRLRRHLARTPFDIEAPPVDEVRRFLPHTGAVAYVNDEEAETFLETYSDQIWLALFGLSIVGSSITGFLGWTGFFDRSSKGDDVTGRVRAVADRIVAAHGPADLDAAQRELDEVVIELLRKYGEQPGAAADGDPSLAHWIASLNAILARRRGDAISSA